MLTFRLAPMSRGIRILTWILLAMPVALVASGLRAPAPAGTLLVIVGLGTAALYAAVWLGWRPTGFEVSPDGLRIRFPAWTRLVPRADLARARALTSDEFKREFGFALRIGVGGLWGGFGWLWTRGRGLVEFYVSRVDGLVLVERRRGRPLLVTPVDPDGFVRSLGSR
jgi:hypothetical protein